MKLTIEKFKREVPIIYEMVEQEFGTDGLAHLDKWLQTNSIPMDAKVKVNFAEVNEVIDELIEKNLNKERWQMRPDNWREFVGYEKALKELKTILSKISA